MIRAHKIRLHPTPKQAEYFAKTTGTRRFVFNCPNCGLECDRDYNASLNIRQEALCLYEKASNDAKCRGSGYDETLNDCGRSVRPSPFMVAAVPVEAVTTDFVYIRTRER